MSESSRYTPDARPDGETAFSPGRCGAIAKNSKQRTYACVLMSGHDGECHYKTVPEQVRS